VVAVAQFEAVPNVHGSRFKEVPVSRSRMQHIAVRSLATLTCVAGALAFAATGRAQETRPATGSINGRVLDPAGRAVAGAELTIPGSTVRVETDDTGEFRLKNVPAGDLSIRVRRLGFKPDTSIINVLAGQTVPLMIALQPLPVVLAPMTILGKHYTGRLASFYQRRDRGMGHYYTRDEIEKRNPANTTDLLRTVPGIRLQPLGFGRQTLRFRGARCPPLVWIDGSPLGAGEFDIDNVPTRSIEAMEIYTGIAALPSEFTAGPTTTTSCGTIVIWSRQGEPRSRKRSKGESAAAEIQRLVESLSVYTADQVDQPARADSNRRVVPIYPHDLYRTATPGEVLVEFVVEPDGTVDMDSFNVVWTTHQAFGESVKRSVRETAWIPGIKQGRTVRQVLQQPFKFVPDSNVRPRT
jgi:carboxypeptidase family protein/TonB-dependent receptor-like protein/TonB-like protein